MSKARPSPQHAARLAAVRAELGRRKLDGLLIVQPQDQYWLTAFTGEDGAALVTGATVVLLTDGRFTQTADMEAPWARKVIRKRRSPEFTAAEIKRARLGRIGFEPAHLTVAAHVALSRLIRPARLVAASGVISALRAIKDPEEIARIRSAIAVAQEAFARTIDVTRPGQTEAEVAARLTFEMNQRGAAPAFAPIVASGPNAALPHYRAGARRLASGEPLLIDWGARLDGYVSDLTRMVWPGRIDGAMVEAFRAVHEAHSMAIASVSAGVVASIVDGAARRVLKRAGLAKLFTHALGHGIGLDVHESPRIGAESTETLRAGMVITVEPGVYMPGVGGVRLEDDVLVTADGCEVLSSAPVLSP